MYRTICFRADGVTQCGDASSESMSKIYAHDAMITKHGQLPGPGSGNGLLVPLENQFTYETFPI